MSKLRYIILLILCLPVVTTVAQRRYAASTHTEYELSKASGFSTKDVENQTDVLFGLHASEYSGSHHLIGVSLDGGWSTFISSMPHVSSMPGGGIGGVHLLYEYQYSGLIVQTGIGAAYQQVTTSLGDTSIYHEHMHDTWNGADREFTLKHHFTGRQDMSRLLYGRIPLYIGHYFFGPRGIGYFLGGVQASYAFWGDSRQSLTGTTTGLYERYIGIWEEMDNHGFRKDVPIEHTGTRLKVKFDLMAHLELGYEYNTRQGAKDYRVRPTDRLDGRIRIAGFAECSMFNICPNTKLALYDIPQETIYDFSTYRIEHVFDTKDAANYWMRNLSVGLRVTFLFGFQPKEHCILCDTWRH